MSGEDTASNPSSNVITNTPSPEGATTSVPGSPGLLSAALGSVVKFYSGLSLGAYQSVITASDADNTQLVELESNDLSGRSTPSVLAFSKCTRLIGDTAENVMAKEPLSTIALLPLLIRASSGADYSSLKERFGPLLSFMESVQSDGTIRIHFGGAEWNLDASQILAAFLRRLAAFVVDGRNAKRNSGTGEVSLSAGQYCICVPDHSFSSPEVRKQCLERLARACRTGAFRWELTKITSQTTAVVAGWLVRNLSSVLDHIQSKTFYVAFLNLGFSEASVQIVKLEKQDDNVMEDAQQQQPEAGPSLSFSNVKVTFDAYETIDVGAYDFAKALARLYVEALAKKNIAIEWNKAFHPTEASGLTRAQRKAVNAVLGSSVKLMKDLSGLAQAHSTYSDEDSDVQIEISRDQFEDANRSNLSAVTEMVTRAVQRSIDNHASCGGTRYELLGVEVVGGGCRIPCVQKGVETIIQGHEDIHLIGDTLIRRTLDGSAAASFGATYIASGLAPNVLPNVVTAADVPNVWVDDSQREAYMHTEKLLRQIESDELRRREASNKLEATLMKFENLARSQEIENASALADITQKYSDWYYDNMNGNVSATDYAKKEEELIAETESICHEYYQREKKKKEDMERELERKAKENEGKEKEDHDFRKLPNSQRLEKAERNKNEGNDMYKAGNWLKAAERYQQALAHLDKMFDESPADQEKKKQLKISLYTNLALVFSKQPGEEALGKVIQRCDMALSYDERNSKVLYHRAVAYEKQKNYENALEDLQRCAKSQAESDGAVDPATTKAIQRVQEKLAKQKEQAKQMYARMF